MNNEFTNTLNELRGVVLDLHRSAGKLDNIICNIESLNEEDLNDLDYMNKYVKHLYMHRVDSNIRNGYGSLNEEENDIWKRLIAATNKEET